MEEGESVNGTTLCHLTFITYLTLLTYRRTTQHVTDLCSLFRPSALTTSMKQAHTYESNKAAIIVEGDGKWSGRILVGEESTHSECSFQSS